MTASTAKLKVLIYGDGNLGHSLMQVAIALNHSFHLVSRNRCVYSDDFANPSDARLIINTIGGKISTDFPTLWKQNIDFNLYLIREYPKKPVFAFSSNAALESWRTPYASIKNTLEQLAHASENLFVMRVSSLYGRYKPSQCFPQKLRLHHPKPCKLELPLNPIQPTPTDWVALKILQGEFKTTHVTDIAPSDHTTPFHWGEYILSPDYKVNSCALLQTRNHFRTLNGEGNPTWLSLWNQYKV